LRNDVPNPEPQRKRVDQAARLRSLAAAIAADAAQPLTAASNYVGAARVILTSSEAGQSDAAVHLLDLAGQQILKAGAHIARLRYQLHDDADRDLRS
jgi:hypothetical protein